MFLQGATPAAAIGLVGGTIWTRRAFARHQLSSALISQSSPVLARKVREEQLTIPSRATAEIKQWFHAKCLRVEQFVEHICSNSYREKLHACRTPEDQNNLLLVSFCGKVVTDSEILTRVQLIADEAGQEIDRDWNECCESIGAKWQLQITDYKKPIPVDQLLQTTEKLIAQHVSEAIAQAKASAQHPAAGETLGKIGASAIMLFPLTLIHANGLLGEFDLANPLQVALALPTFIFVSLQHVFQYVCGLLADPKPDLQRAISGRLALLGNRVGAEFESEIRRRLDALHDWQEQSLADVADHYADSVVPWL
jgi:hypothetical protein